MENLHEKFGFENWERLIKFMETNNTSSHIESMNDELLKSIVPLQLSFATMFYISKCFDISLDNYYQISELFNNA